MKTLQFTYNGQYIEFLQGRDNVMVNATQMARVFNKRLDHFLRADHTKAFVNELEFTPFGGNLKPLKREAIIKSRGKSGTYMHRILALKFAAWLDPKFEVWVFTTIDKILYAHFQDIKVATLEKIQIEKEREQMREELLQKHPEDFGKFLALEGKLTKADQKRINAIKASTQELRINFYENIQDAQEE